MCFTLTSGFPIMPIMCQAHYRPSVKLYLPEPIISAHQVLSQEKCMPWHQHYTSTLRELSDLKLGSIINQSIEGRIVAAEPSSHSTFTSDTSKAYFLHTHTHSTQPSSQFHLSLSLFPYPLLNFISPIPKSLFRPSKVTIC